ncbi:MAG: transglutaminaseTgpA domain-containing protein, partial [Opitutales bacterium]
RLWAAADLRFAGFSSFLFVSMVGLSSMIFLVLPRIDIDNRLNFRGLEQPGLTGFSDQIGLNDITNIQEDHRTALRIDPPARSREEIPAEPYWRMLVLDEYNDGRFRVSDAASNFMLHHAGASFTARDLRWHRLEAEESRRQTDWHFYLEGGVAQYLPRGGPFREIRMSERNANLQNFHFAQVLALDSIKSSMFSYGLIGMQFSDRIPDPVFGRSLRSQGRDEARAPISRGLSQSAYEEEVRNRILSAMNELALSVPVRGTDAAYLRGKVETILNGEDLTPREFAARAKDHLQSRHAYSLTSRVQPGRGDPVVRWMQQESEGHCEYFAAAMILLSRTAGYPARAVTGFYGGTWNPYEDYLMVRFSDAHAWVEIYDKEDGGGVWFRADATPAGGDLMFPSDVAQRSGWSLSVDSSLRAYLDSIRVLWYRQVVSFDEEGQEHFFAAIKSRITGWSERVVDGVMFLWTSFIDGWKEGRGLWQILYMTAGAAGLAILYYALKGVAGQIFSLLFPGRSRASADPVRRRAAAWLRRIARKQSRATTGPAVPEEELFAVRRKLQALRYGPHSRGVEAGSIFRAARSLVKRIR